MTEQGQPQETKEPAKELVCPNCGSAKRVGLTLATQEAARLGSKVPPNIMPFIQVSQFQVGTNIFLFMFDACEQCNVVYLVGRQKQSTLVVPQVNLRNIRLPGPGDPGFGLG